MTSTSKRETIRRYLQEHPEMSDRQIAKHIGCSNSTVSTARRKLKACSTAPHTEEFASRITELEEWQSWLDNWLDTFDPNFTGEDAAIWKWSDRVDDRLQRIEERLDKMEKAKR